MRHGRMHHKVNSTLMKHGKHTVQWPGITGNTAFSLQQGMQHQQSGPVSRPDNALSRSDNALWEALLGRHSVVITAHNNTLFLSRLPQRGLSTPTALLTPGQPHGRSGQGLRRQSQLWWCAHQSPSHRVPCGGSHRGRSGPSCTAQKHRAHDSVQWQARSGWVVRAAADSAANC